MSMYILSIKLMSELAKLFATLLYCKLLFQSFIDFHVTSLRLECTSN